MRQEDKLQGGYWFLLGIGVGVLLTLVIINIQKFGW